MAPGLPGRSCAAVLVLAAFGASAGVSAQEAMDLPRLPSPIVVDGMPDEEVWQTIPALPLTMYAPVFRGTPSQRSEIRVAYDDENFYAAGWFYDSDPSGIRINSLYRDRWNGDDAFAIYVDAFNDNQNAKWFGTTPGGIRFDQLVSDDGATLNENWDSFWTAKTRVTDRGWFAEVRIPFSTLGFRVGPGGRAVMGLTVTRLISRTGERVTFPEIDPAFPFRRPSLARDVAVAGVRSEKPWYLTPYALTGVQRTSVAGAATRLSETDREVGLDVRYPLSGRLTLDLTLNTDFAQVEADGQQVALDRFPLFYPERRRFFQEGSGIFDFVTAGGTRLFHSRRIGLTEGGAPVPILGGARLVGRSGAWDIGALNVHAQEYLGRPDENFGVFRMRRAILNDWSTAGFMLTTLAGAAHDSAALGSDLSLRVHGDEYLTVKWAATLDSLERDRASLASRSLFDGRWERRTGRGLAYTFQLSRAGLDFLPALGFLPRRDYTTANALANWYFFTNSHRVFSRVWPGALAFSTFRNRDGALESGQYAVWVQWETKAGGGGWIEPKAFHEDVAAPFRIGGQVDIPAGAYDFADLQVVYTMPSGARLRTSVDARAGTYFDGRRAQVILSPTWNVSPHLEVGGEYQLTTLRFPVRGQNANIQLAGLRVRTALDARASANALVQYNSTTRKVDVNLRLRYAVSEGTDLWLVYNEGLATERRVDDLGTLLPRSLSRGVVVKYTHTFGM